MTTAGRPGPQRRWRSLSGNLINRRGDALVPPILMAVTLNVAAVAGLADIAGFRAVYTSLTRIQWLWLCALPAALAMSAIGHYFAYRQIYAAEGGYQLSHRQPTAMVAAGFGGLFSTGGIQPALTIGCCTGMVFTRRTAPLAGSGTLTLILPLTIWATGAPLATAVIGVWAYRLLCFWLPLPFALASLPALRETTRQAVPF